MLHGSDGSASVTVVGKILWLKYKINKKYNEAVYFERPQNISININS